MALLCLYKALLFFTQRDNATEEWYFIKNELNLLLSS